MDITAAAKKLDDEVTSYKSTILNLKKLTAVPKEKKSERKSASAKV